MDPYTTEERWVTRRKEDDVDLQQLYLRDVRRFALLEPEEEERQIRLLEEGRQAAVALAEPGVSPDELRALDEREERGREARDRIVLANLRATRTSSASWPADADCVPRPPRGRGSAAEP